MVSAGQPQIQEGLISGFHSCSIKLHLPCPVFRRLMIDQTLLGRSNPLTFSVGSTIRFWLNNVFLLFCQNNLQSSSSLKGLSKKLSNHSGLRDFNRFIFKLIKSCTIGNWSGEL